MVTGGVDEYAGVVPGSRFETGILLNRAEHFETPVRYGQHVLAQKSDQIHIGRPDDMAALGNLDLSRGALLLDVEQSEAVSVAEQHATRTGVEDFIARWSRHLLRYLVLLILDNNLRQS